jgi:hypothetical protein
MNAVICEVFEMRTCPICVNGLPASQRADLLLMLSSGVPV